MPERPTSAFVLSMAGGAITLVSGLLSIDSWYFMYSNSGPGFTYSMIGDLLNFTSGEALVLFVLGAICGVLIFVGAILLRSGVKSKVRLGSILILASSILGIPGTFFGLLIGGILSVAGAVST